MRIYLPLVFLFTCCFLSSCVPHRELINFDEANLSNGLKDSIPFPIAMVVQPNDLLRIQVQAVDPEAALPFNPAETNNGLQLNGNNLQLFRGYLVDQQGFIDFPVVGRIKAEGESIESLQELLREQLKTYLKEPIVNIRFLNFKVTLLGEVVQPGVISLPNARVTLLEAIGLAGDLTPYANRRTVLVIREKDGARTYGRIDLHKKGIFDSPYYFLQQNDLVYVEPLRARTATVADRGQRVISYGTAVLSLAALILTLTQR